MIGLYLVLAMCAIFLSAIALGSITYKYDKKTNFSFLGMFPFEMKSEKFPVSTLVFRILMDVAIGLMCASSLYMLWFDAYSGILNKALCLIMLLASILLMSSFIISFKSLNNHILMSSIFSTLVFISYALFGYITIRQQYEVYNLFQTIASFAGAIILLFLIFFPPLVNWYKMKKSVTKEGEETYIRGKVNILALFEWISIFLFSILYIIISLSGF